MFEKRKDTDKRKDVDKRNHTHETSAQSEPALGSPTSTEKSFTSRSTAMIGQTIQVKGSITGNENLVIEGNVDGSVSLPDNDLTIGESGQVVADLIAKTVKVDGQVTGDITGTEKVIVSKTGRVNGNIVAPRVTLEDGAKFKGSIDMDPGEARSSTPMPAKSSIKSDLGPKEIKQESS